MFQSSVGVEILVHYLAAVNEGSAVIPGDASGQSVNIRWEQKIKIKDLKDILILCIVLSLKPNLNPLRRGLSRETRRSRFQ